MASGRVPGFAPSRSGLHFANDFPREPLFRAGMGALAVPIGNAANGLCGGMVLTARDLYERGVQPPSTREVPGPGTPLFRYLRRRLFDSFNLPMGPLRYWPWQPLPA